ncbi:metallophosphoesterase [Lentisphaerota bacterium ZTH]|nr:metallophosphoesterase [Lentisphaerota bacterium]WET05486.1 metallophosphoesterase [Lentisphaerota bacterium ZTH]
MFFFKRASKSVKLISAIALLSCAIFVIGAASSHRHHKSVTQHKSKKLYIISTNDLHQHTRYKKDIDGFIAGFKAKHKSPVIWLDAGDVLEVFKKFRGKATRDDMFKWISKCDGCVPGNHDYYKGLNYLADMSWKYNVPYICSNISSYPEGIKKLHVITYKGKPSNIIVRKGLKIGIVGICAPEMNHRRKSDAAFKVCPCCCSKIKDKVKWLRKRCDFVILLTHQKDKLDYKAAKYAGADVVIGGHSHSKSSSQNRVWHHVVTKAGWKGEYIGVTTISKKLINGHWQTSSSSYLAKMKK